MTKMTVNGVTTTKTPGQEKYEKFSRRIGRKTKTFYSYDYRDLDGELFSCIKPTLRDCWRAKEDWIKRKEEAAKKREEA